VVTAIGAAPPVGDPVVLPLPDDAPPEEAPVAAPEIELLLQAA
jgi:hypothetical protein